MIDMEIRAALLAMWEAYSRNMARHGSDGDCTWTDEDHAEWQEVAGRANALLPNAQSEK